MYHLLYTSTATEPFKEDKLNELLKNARENNLKVAITGMLLYCQETFIQILEGDKQVVTNTFERIKNDGRHHHVNIVTNGETEQRQFPDWSMGFRWVAPTELAKLEGVDNLNVKEYLSVSKPYKILKLLSRNHWM